MGNLQSVQKAFEHLGAPVKLVTTASEIAAADKLVLPGVGAFRDAMHHLDEQGVTAALREFAESGRPLLGVCLGLQLLFEASEEAPGVSGLGLFPGTVRRFEPAADLKVPHMGWNSLQVNPSSRVLAGLGGDPFVYFVHSYYVEAAEAPAVAATTTYGVSFVSAVERGNVAGLQFHPEKSQKTGLKILTNFVRL